VLHVLIDSTECGREKSGDGKSYVNPQHGILSKSYREFADGITNGPRGGFDVHIYYYQVRRIMMPASFSQISTRKMPIRLLLQRRYGSECGVNVGVREWSTTPRLTSQVPELRIYRLFDRPIGPHPIAMFEVNIFTPAQFGAFIPWLVINRGPLSALVHPNTENESEEARNHTQRATWLGERLPLDMSLFREMGEEMGVPT
jgi:aromatic ring-cleaving dioxygenase